MPTINSNIVRLGAMLDDEYEKNVYRDKWEDIQENYDYNMERNTTGGEIDQGMFSDIKDQLGKMPMIRPIPNFQTKNKSFIKLHKRLKKMGIRNNTFFLNIYDRGLIGIDPFNQDLPLEYQIRIYIEIIRNPWYWLREICRIPEDGCPICVGGGSPFLIDRNSLASWYCFLNGIDQYDSKPRQTGKTQNAIAIMNYSYHFGTLATNFTFANKDAGNNKTNLYRLKCQRDMMPEFLQMKISIGDDGNIIKGRDSVTSMRNPITGNMISLLPRANSKDSAMTCGRGLTSAICYFDEFDFMPWNTEVLHSAAFAYSKASENAQKNKSLYGRVFTSTPGDLDNRDGAEATAWIANMFVWEDKYLDYDINELKRMAIGPKSGRNGIVFIEHSWQQLGLSREWYENQCQKADFKKEVILREILLQRLHGSSSSPFNPDDLMYLQEHIGTIVSEDDMSKNLCPFTFYEKMNRRYPYVIAVDPSMGMAGDNTAINIDNPYTGKTVAEFKSPYISQEDTCNMIVKFMDKYSPNGLIVVESNRGTELINRLLKTKYRYRVWYDSDKMGERPRERVGEYYNSAVQSAYERRAYGFNTNRSTRGLLFNLLETLVTEEKEKLNSAYVVDDIFKLERRNGKVQASAGHHDDMILAKLIGTYVFRTATNLDEFNIVRGIAPPVEEDEDSPDYQRKKIKEILAQLPQEIQQQIEPALALNDAVDDAWKYQAEVQKEMEKISNRSHTRINENSDGAIDADDYDSYMENYDNAIFDTNFNGNDSYNLDDFI